MLAFVETLTESELEALVNGGPIARQRSWRAFERWRKGCA
jgi:hypothetical protein